MPESKGKHAVIIAPSTTRHAYPLHLPHFPPPQSDGVALESYPMASPSDKPYDEQLLAHAPEVTKADLQVISRSYDLAKTHFVLTPPILQDGYNPDILVPQRPPASRVLSPDSDSDRHDVESAGGASQPKEKIYSTKAKSFWKTKKGIIVLTSIVILIAVILGAVLGGVLGSRKGGGDQPTPTSTTSPNSGNSTDGQDSVGQDQGTMPLPGNGNDSKAQNGQGPDTQ